MKPKVSPYRIEMMKLSDFLAVSQLWRNSEGIGLNESDIRTNIAIFLKRNPAMPGSTTRESAAPAPGRGCPPQQSTIECLGSFVGAA